ncbi:MAG: WG repeat-containing protein [Oscillospiraceae bacterium]|jgi:hypothetical protein|nr:WG repeat-containing protein [Oscillospiraceae bacterium]
MKSWRLFIAALLLCSMAACHQPGEPSPPPAIPSATEDATPSGLSPTPEPSPAPSPSPSPPAPPRETPAYAVVLPDGLPDRLAFDTDEVGSRYYEEASPTLRPRPDYGRLYPFVGAAAGDGWGSITHYLGLCTEEGQIVVDPVYTNVEIVEKDGKMMYALQRYIELEGDVTFAALDGSWAVTYQDSDRSFLRYEAGYYYYVANQEYISVYDGTGWGAIGYDGKLVYPCRERFPVQFSEGLAVVWSEDGERYSYVNIKGQTVIGPFEAPEPLDGDAQIWQYFWRSQHFNYGLARFQEDGLYGFIDKTGKVVIEPQFDFAAGFFGEYGVVGTYNNIAIDRKGNRLATAGKHIETVDETTFIIHGGVIGGLHHDRVLMNSAGEVLSTRVLTRQLDNGWMVGDYSDNPSRLEKDGEVIKLPYQIWHGLPEDRFVFYRYDDELEQSVQGIVDKTGAVLMEIRKGNVEVLPSGRIQTSRWERGVGYYGLWDVDYQPLLPTRYQFLTDYGDYFAARDGYFGGLLDKEGNWVVRRSLLDTLLD